MLESVQSRVLELFPGVSFAFGETNVAQHAKHPRVVWLRAAEGSSVGTARTTSREQAALLDRSAVVIAVCWAARDDGSAFETDDAALEALMDSVELALRECLGTALILPLAEKWTTEGWTQAGKSAHVAFAVRMPVTKPAPEVVGTETIEVDVGLDPTGDSDTDGILQATEG